MSQELDDFDVAATLAAAEQSVVDRHAAEVRALLVDLHFAALHSGEPELSSELTVRRDGRTKLVRVGGEGTPEVQDLPICELAVARRTTLTAARRHLADALDLAHRLPKLWNLLKAGRGEVWVARRAALNTRHLQHEAMPSIDAALAGAIDESVGRVLSVLDAEVIRADPEAAAERVEESRRQRCLVIGQSDEDGLRHILGRIDAGDAAWLDAMVERVGDALMERGLLDGATTRDEVRAEALGWLAHPQAVIDLLSGHAAGPTTSAPQPSRAKAVVHVHLAADAVAGLLSARGVARVEELGPLLVAELTRLLRHARIDLKPVIDLSHSRSVNAYEHPADVVERGYLRTTGDVFPHAVGQSRRCDSDHPVPYDAGPDKGGGPPGQTGDENHAPLGRTHHRAKTHLGYRLTQLGLSRYLWRTPHGLWRLVDGSGTHPMTAEVARALLEVREGRERSQQCA